LMITQKDYKQLTLGSKHNLKNSPTI
jgi:hypothetical protein